MAVCKRIGAIEQVEFRFVQSETVGLDERADAVSKPPRAGSAEWVSDVVDNPTLDPEPDARGSLSVTEFFSLGAAVAVGVVALVSLATAHLRIYSNALVWSFSLVALALTLVVVARWDRPRFRLDFLGLIPAVLGAAVAGVTMMPGFQYATGDRDPGAYVEHAVAIQRTGSIDFPNDLLANHLPTSFSDLAVWPGLWVEPGHPDMIFPQFYHLWPALLATAKGVGGYTGLFDTGPLLGVLCVIAASCIGRRLAGWPGAWAGAVLLSTNMLQVWQAKYPSSEIFAQFLFLGASLAVVIAIQTGWRTAAAVGGVMVGLSYLERPDGLVIVLMAWVGLAVLLAARKFDSRALAFAVGLIVLLPYGFYQAYDLARVYTIANAVPSLPKVLLVMAFLVGLSALLNRQQRLVQSVIARCAQRQARLNISVAFIALCALLMIIGGLRPRLFGQDFALVQNTPMRTFDEISFIRLSWFFSLFGLAMAGAGIAYVALRKWRLDAWLIALPAVGLLSLYCYHVRNSAYMMWSTRRFVPTVVPGLVILIGCGVALAVLLIRRWLPTIVAVATAILILAGLTTFYLRQSWPLRDHNENGGSVDVVQQIASVAQGQKGIFLWQAPNYCCAFPSQLFGGPLFSIADQSSAPLPPDPASITYAVTQYLAFGAKTGRPVFYIADRTSPPPVVAGMSATKVREVAGVLPHWEETFITRPDKTADYKYDMMIYRLVSG